MKTKRFQLYLQQKKTSPIKTREEVAQSSDNKIDEDFPGYPHGQSKKEVIKPETQQEKKTAAVGTKDGEKRQSTGGKKKQTDEQESDGSGGAFGGTEDVRE